MKSCCLDRFRTVCLVAVVCVPCSANSPSSDGIEYFEKHIRPLLASRCYACHSMRAKEREGGLLLDTRSGWAIGGDRGQTVVPGDVEASLLIQAVRYTDPDLQMPPDRALPKSAVDLLEQWVRMGAPDPRDASTTDQAKVLQNNPSDPIAGRNHWAFGRLTELSSPQVEMADWPRSTIDSFILARLEANQLRPAADANRRVLLRRLFFQLIGLPPNASQLAQFLHDEEPDAIERVVDELLKSPHFGERWGRHWLDLARYADSNGLDENFLFREAWRYRDWVIDAVNTDKPFDRFLLEQIAGDLLPYQSIQQRDRQRIAAGFMVVGPKVLLGNDARQRRMDVADEQLDTIGRAILGQTLGCARCHDHKFDPIPTADYYALAGILTSTQVMERRYMLGQQRVMERLVGLGANGDELNGAYEQYWRERPKLKERQTKAKQAADLLVKGNEKAFNELVENHADAVAPGAADRCREVKDRIESQKAFLASLNVLIAKPPGIPPRAMIPCDVNEPANESIRLAGQFDRLGETVPRGVLRVIGNATIDIPEGQSGRLQLAAWLTDGEAGAGNLAARVLANRVWHHLIGRGMVRTVDNFGRTGEPPSHPALLDHLALELINSGWSIKSLVRKIVLSRTFMMSSQHDERGHSLDPENRLLWRAHRRRLDPESLRDAMLVAADTLDRRPVGSTVSYLGDQATAVGANKNRRRTNFLCRSVYLPVIRNDLPELFDVFDFADPHATTGMRPDTMVATQGLFILNDESVMDAAESAARRLINEVGEHDQDAILNRVYVQLLHTTATDEEREEVLMFVRETQQHLFDEGHQDAVARAWSMVCHAIFASSRFQLLE